MDRCKKTEACKLIRSLYPSHPNTDLPLPYSVRTIRNDWTRLHARQYMQNTAPCQDERRFEMFARCTRIVDLTVGRYLVENSVLRLRMRLFAWSKVPRLGRRVGGRW